MSIFIKNSYKITNKSIYFFIDDEYYDYEEVIRRYSRYKAKCSSKGSKEEYIITVEVDTMKYNFFKAFLYGSIIINISFFI